MNQRFSRLKEYSKELYALDVVGWVLQANGSAELAAQVWPIVAPLVVLALLPHLDSVPIAVPGWAEGSQEFMLWLSRFYIRKD